MMIPVDAMALHEFDREHDTRTSSKFGESYMGLITGIMFILAGIACIIITIIDLDTGIYNNGKTATIAATLTLTENPFWPTYGKGYWVGLVMIATGILGIMAHVEETITAIKIYAIMSFITAWLSFYMILSAAKEVDLVAEAKKVTIVPLGFYVTFNTNSALCAFGAATFLLGIITGVVALTFTDCLEEVNYELSKSTDPVQYRYR